MLHIYQLKDYNLARFSKHFLNKKLAFIIFSFIVFILQIALNNNFFTIITDLLLIIISIIYIKFLISPNKTPLKFTKKAIRIFAISIVLILIISTFKHSISFILSVCIFLMPFANFLNVYDKVRNKKFINLAKNKLKHSNTKIIAITGSNGKTSVKNILFEMLKTSFNVLATPKSYNTPLGISKYINEELSSDCEYLILEYGARHKNDIKKLCNLFGADYGIVTCVAPQHLQSFKSIQNIFRTKKELADFLNKKMCVFNLDNIYSLMMFQEKRGEKLSVSLSNSASITASNIVMKNFKTHFTIYSNNKSFNVKTSLLGDHNITNILLSYALASHLGVDDNKIIASISNLKPVEHRLQHIKSNVNILDDSYNCSLSSAREALSVLKQCKNKRMVVTPGIVEGGNSEHKLNVELGKMCAEIDYCVIVGKHNKKALLEGLKFNKTNVKIYVADSLEQSKQYFSILKENDTILLLNDLPDDYN